MFKHTVAYIDFNGNERKEDLYFHLSTPEVVRLEAEVGKPLDEYAKDIAVNMDLKGMLLFLEKVILSAYGQKTADGRSFQKNIQLREEFEHSQAYAQLFEDIIQNPDLAKKFGESVVNTNNQKNRVTPQVVSD